MVTMKCKFCDAQMVFGSLREKDFPNGWVCENCKKAKKEPKMEEAAAPVEASEMEEAKPKASRGRKSKEKKSK